MGNATSNNGWLTQVVETIPGGGLITAPVHIAAGNNKQAAVEAGGVALDAVTLGGASVAAKSVAKAAVTHAMKQGVSKAAVTTIAKGVAIKTGGAATEIAGKRIIRSGLD